MKVLFVCKGNWFRSQVAEAIYNKLTNSSNAYSVGTYVGADDEPEGQILSDLPINEDFFVEMESHGLKIRSNKTKKLTTEMLNEYDVVVSMVEEPYVPSYLKDSGKVIWWDVANSNNTDKEVSKRTYNQIYKLVVSLINK